MLIIVGGIAIIGIFITIFFHILIPDHLTPKNVYYETIVSEISYRNPVYDTVHYVFTLESGVQISSDNKPFYKVGQCIEFTTPKYFKDVEVVAIVNDFYCKYKEIE